MAKPRAGNSAKEKEEENDYNEYEEEAPIQGNEVQPQNKITIKSFGLIMKFNFMRTVKSLDELDKFRFKVMQICIILIKYFFIRIAAFIMV
jgi:hypothetical protein